MRAGTRVCDADEDRESAGITAASRRTRLWKLAPIGVALLLGCNLENEGDAQPAATLYFPNALALSEHESGDPRYLFVANSNLDLRYNAGTLQAISLERLEEALDACEGRADCTVEPADVIEDEVRIGSFSTSIAYARSQTGGQDYVLVTTRTDDSLTFALVDPEADGDDVLRCDVADEACDLLAVRGTEPGRDEAIAWPLDPAAVIAGPLSDWADAADRETRYALVAHRGGEVSLFLEDPAAGADAPSRFVLSDRLEAVGFPLTNVAFERSTRLAHLTIGSRGIARVGFAPPRADDEATEGVDETLLGTLYNAGTLTLESVASQPDTRDLAFLPPLSDAGEALAHETALLVAQNPSALLLADFDPSRNEVNTARIKRTAVVGAGASRLAAGVLSGRPIAVVASFDARALFVIDLETMLTLSVVPNLSGPFEIVLDEGRGLVYVADFRSSVIRVVRLSELFDTQGSAPARVVATIGRPRVVQELR